MNTVKETSMKPKNSVSIQVLSYVCETVNRVNLKNVASFKEAEKWAKFIGFRLGKVLYVNSYRYDGYLIDVYEHESKSIIMYIREKTVLGFKILNPNYYYKEYLRDRLKNFSMIEISGGVLYNRLL